jgi:hypothetical protein
MSVVEKDRQMVREKDDVEERKTWFRLRLTMYKRKEQR